MLLTDVQIRRAKAQDKPYTLNDGNGLSLLIDTNGGKGWRFRYRFAGKAKMISFGVYGDVSLAVVRKKRDAARNQLANGINPSDARRANKIALAHTNNKTFEAIAREWHSSKLPTWSTDYADYVMRGFEKNVYPYIGKRPIDQIARWSYLPFCKK